MESFFRVEFVFEDPPQEAFDRLVSLFEQKKEMPKYLKRSERRMKIVGESRNFSLRVISDSELNSYEYEESTISLDLTCSVLFQGGSPGEQQLDETFALIRRFYEEIDAQYVFGMHSERIETIGLPENRNGILSPINEDSLAQNRIVASTWLMLFPPAMVEEYDREWLLDLPAARIDELDDGAIMIVATTGIFDAESDLEIANAVGDGLRPLEDAFAEKHRS